MAYRFLCVLMKVFRGTGCGVGWSVRRVGTCTALARLNSPALAKG